MKCKNEFIYRGIEKRDAGSFVNDKGEKVDYKGYYKLKVDEATEDGVRERIFKIPESDKKLIEILDSINVYDKIVVELDVQIFGSRINLVPENIYLA